MAKKKGKTNQADASNKKKKPSKTRSPGALLASLVSVIVPVLALAGFAIVEQAAYKDQTQQSHVAFFTPTFQKQMHLAFDRLNFAAKSLAQHASIRSAMQTKNAALLDRFAQSIIAENPEIKVLRLIPFQTIHRPDQTSPRMRFTELEMMRKLEREDPITPELIQDNGNTLIRYGITVKSSNGSVLGTVLLHFDKKEFDRFFVTLPDDMGHFKLSRQGADDKPAWFETGQAASVETPNHIEIITVLGAPWRLEYHSPATLPSLGQNFIIKALVIGLCVSFSLLIVQFIVTKSWTRAVERNLQRLTAKATSYTSNAGKDSYSLPGFAAAHRNLTESIENIKQKLIAQFEAQAPRASSALEPESAAQPQLEEKSALLDMDLDLADDDLFESIDSAEPDLLGAGISEASSHSSGINGPAISVPAGIFREYDIRGIMGESLSTETAVAIGKAIGTVCLKAGENKVIMAQDGRLSSPELAQSLVSGLTSTGCNVIDIGVVPTPLMYFGTKTLGTESGVMVTGSHNPPEYNGFKVMVKGKALYGQSIKDLHQIIESKQFASGDGSQTSQSNLTDYIEKVASGVSIGRKLKVVVDTGNGVAGPSVKALLEKLGCELTMLNEQVDGSFPNHHPDPSNPENLSQLIQTVTDQQADIGLAFDGDGDRIGVVTNAGNIIFPDRLLMLFISNILTKKPGSEIIYDVKCTSDLGALITKLGGKPTMWKTGHSLIKAKIQETNAVLGGEMSGHIFFNDRWYGFDDALYSAARLLEILSNTDKTLDQLDKMLPQKVSTPELNIPAPETSKFQLVQSLVQSGSFTGDIITLDGIRVQYPNGWGLIRASNTTPNLVARFEADTGDNLATIQKEFRNNLQQIDSSLKLPF